MSSFKNTHRKPVTFDPIGVVKTSFTEPLNPKDIRNSASILVIDKKYQEALEGLKKFSHILVIYYIHKAKGYDLKVHPMGDISISQRGLFATRSPRRPNHIGVTVAKLLDIKKNEIKVTGLDALNESPILDIKPYEDHFDAPAGVAAERDPRYSPNDG
ncbi:MAG: tRNA (N6-threonylcarbamoyladenosine(37)-N6)-methyltransferase TrmO [Methanotrichaceae archaeon]